MAVLAQLFPLCEAGEGAVGERAFQLAPAYARACFPRHAAARSAAQGRRAAAGAVLRPAAALTAAKKYLFEAACLELHCTTMLRALMHAVVSGAPGTLSRVRALQLASTARGLPLLEARSIVERTAPVRSRIATAAVDAAVGVSAARARRRLRRARCKRRRVGGALPCACAVAARTCAVP